MNSYSQQIVHLEEKDKFLETYNLPKLSQAGTDNLNRPITRSEVESIMKKLPLMEIQD